MAFVDAYSEHGQCHRISICFATGVTDVLLFLLYSHRTDIVVADKLIFEYLIPQLGRQFNTRVPLQFHAIFPPTHYQLLFNDAKLRDQFNRGLAIIRSNDQYQLIQNHYLIGKTGKELKTQ